MLGPNGTSTIDGMSNLLYGDTALVGGLTVSGSTTLYDVNASRLSMLGPNGTTTIDGMSNLLYGDTALVGGLTVSGSTTLYDVNASRLSMLGLMVPQQSMEYRICSTEIRHWLVG